MKIKSNNDYSSHCKWQRSSGQESYFLYIINHDEEKISCSPLDKTVTAKSCPRNLIEFPFQFHFPPNSFVGCMSRVLQ